MKLFFKRLVTLFAIFGMFGTQLVATTAHAGLIGTDALVQDQQVQAQRAELIAMMEREQVREQLVEMGVDPVAAKQRVAQLNDAEINTLHQQVADLPAGGDVLGILLVIFLVFVVTDVIGATDIFPFIHPVN